MILRALKPSTIMQVINQQGVSIFVTVPRMLDSMKNALESRLKSKWLGFTIPREGYRPNLIGGIIHAKIRHKFGKKFRFFLSGGAPLNVETETFFEGLSMPILQGYGLTETSPVLSYNHPNYRKKGSVGKLLKGVKIKFTKEKEILVKGPMVFKKYYKNSTATKKSFTSGWYKTGDIGELKEGSLYLKGRAKDIIVTPEGFNVYPEDIETILKSIKGVKDACVLGLNSKGGEEVHAVLILNEANARDVIRKANSKLDTAQQINSHTVWTKGEFPRTSTLKVRKFKVKEEIRNTQQKKSKNISKVTEIISRVIGKNPNKIKKGMILAKDLGLSSIDRVELVTLLEQELNVDVDEGEIDNSTTVGNLERIVANKEKAHLHWSLRPWTQKKFCHKLRFVYQELANYPWIKSFGLTVIGKENLKDIKEPVVFIANHESQLDGPIIRAGLRRTPMYKNLAIAGWAEFFFPVKNVNLINRICRRLLFEFTTTFYNLVPLSQSRGFLKSIRNIGRLLEQKWNILIFPEGHRSWDGKVDEFMSGIGLIAKEMKVTIVPLRIEGAHEAMPRGKLLFKRKPLALAIGKPLYYNRGTYPQIAQKLENEVKQLTVKIN